MVLLCVFGFFAAMGLYFLAASVLHLPTHGAERAMAVRGRKKASVSQLLDHRLFGISVWVSALDQPLSLRTSSTNSLDGI